MILSAENDLIRTTPEQQGIDSSAVLQFVDALEHQIQEIHSFMLLRHGYVIAEGWWSPYGYEHPHLVFSVSKSFTATAVGFALQEKYFSIDDPVIDFFPEEIPEKVNNFLNNMTVRHLLSMSTGHAVDTWANMVNRPDGNWINGFLNTPVLYEPGTHFIYNTGATYMLSAIVQKTSGMKLLNYLEQSLFESLGIKNATWQESPQGITAGGIGLSIKTEDVARLGQFYLNKGNWQGRQILSEDWINNATTPQISNSDGMNIDWSQGYGYQFSCCRHNAYRGNGVFGQYCIVMPEQDAVLAITGGIDVFDMQQPLELVWDILLPAMNTHSMSADPVASTALSSRLKNLHMSPVEGEGNSVIARQISGRTYTVDVNGLMIKTIALNFTETGCEITLDTSHGKETIVSGYGIWTDGQTKLFNQPLLFDYARIATSSAWKDSDIFTIIFRLYETPFYYTADFYFDGHEMTIEIQINVSLESMKPQILTAQIIG